MTPCPLEVARGSHPTGEYLEWRSRGGSLEKVATYVPVSEESGEPGRLPKG